MTDAINTTPATSNDVMVAPPFYPWRDAYGREHPDIPRCIGAKRPRNSVEVAHLARLPAEGRRQARHVRRETWFCLQHDPTRRDEQRVAELAPVFMELLRQALDLMRRTKRSGDWLRRAEAVLARAEGRRP